MTCRRCPVPPQPPALGPEPLREHSISGTQQVAVFPQAPQAASGAPPQMSKVLTSGQGSLHSPEWGPCAGAPHSHPASTLSPGAPGLPGRSPETGAQSPPIWRSTPAAPLLASAWEFPGLTLGGILFLWSRLRKQDREVLRTRWTAPTEKGV